MNATYLFERQGLGGPHPTLPHSSESFWTSLFSLFLLHLGKKKNNGNQLSIWWCKKPPYPPWYEPRPKNSFLDLRGLEFDDLAVEPPTLAGRYFETNVEVPPNIGGIRPDVLVRLRSAGSNIDTRYVLIENKTVGADLNTNQLEGYARLLSFLDGQNIQSQFLLLLSVGTTEAIYRSAKALQQKLEVRFGLLLWEDILQQMKESQFNLPGLDIDGWQKYTQGLDTDVGLRVPIA